jgi:ribokinase
MRPRVAVVGSVNVDLVAHCDRLPRPGETVSGATFERYHGGKGANQAVAASRLRAETTMIACVGDDEDGNDAVAALAGERVNTSRITPVSVPTGVALVVVAADGENQIVVAPGANALLTPDLVDVSEVDAVLCQLEIPLEAVKAAAERTTGVFCLNAAPARELPRDLLERCNLVIVNRGEAELLDLTAPRGLVGVTLGPEGAVLLERGQEVARARPPAVEAVDATAAGDAFCAALLVSLLEGRSRQGALERACAAGALTASRPGAQPSLPTAAELEAILRSR